MVDIASMSDRRRWALASVAVAFVVTIARRWISRGRDEYAIWPDEPAQLAIARFVGGGTRWNMDNHSVWRPLFGTILAPVYWFTDDPTTVFHTALTLNAVLGGLAAGLLVQVARRLTPLTIRWCAAVALIVSLAPSVIFTADFVFSESLVAPLFLATLLVLLRLHESPTRRDAVLAALLAGAAFGAHSRMLPLTLITIGVIGLAAFRRRMALRDAAIGIATALAAAYAVSAYTSYLVDRIWNQPSTRNSIGGVREQLTSRLPVLVSALGQSWYLLVASIGIVAFGVIALVRAATGPEQPTAPTRGDARLVLVVVGACVALSIVFMSDRWRSDQLVYGRYNDAVVTPVLVVGLAVLIGAIPLQRVVAFGAAIATAVLLGGAGLWALRSDVLSDSNGLEPMILGLQPFATSDTAIDVLRISVWASALAFGLAGISHAARRHARAVVVLAAVGVLVTLAGIRTSTIVDQFWDDSGDISAVEVLRDGVLPDGVAVDFYLPPGSTATSRMMLYQFHLPRTEFTVVHDRADGATSKYVFAKVTGDGFENSGARLVWRDPRGLYGLWER